MRFSPTLFIAALLFFFTPLFAFALPYPNPASQHTMSTEKLKGVEKLKDKCAQGWNKVKDKCVPDSMRSKSTQEHKNLTPDLQSELAKFDAKRKATDKSSFKPIRRTWEEEEDFLE
jgi:hypothetical protein